MYKDIANLNKFIFLTDSVYLGIIKE